MQKLLTQILKFGIVGIVATLVDFIVMIALHEWCGVHPIMASICSFSVSAVVNYLASMRFVFTHREDLSKLREFIIFVVLSVIGLGINALIMWWGEIWFFSIGVDYTQGLYYVLVKVLATGVVMTWNFVSRKVLLDADRS